MSKPVIYAASDHRGFAMKAMLIALLQDRGYEVRDLGTDSEDSCDASDFAVRLAEALRRDVKARGILVCGTGQAMAMTANRFRHIRAALCTNGTMARLAREHNDANVLVLGSAVIGPEVARECLDVFMNTKFLGGRYSDRIAKLNAIGGL